MLAHRKHITLQNISPEITQNHSQVASKKTLLLTVLAIVRRVDGAVLKLPFDYLR